MLRSTLRFGLGLACALSLVGACAGTETTSPVPTGPALGALESIVSFGAAMPEGIDLQPANNNLDVVTHAGRTWLAWRTAPTHFASADATMYVASEGPDGWRFEGKFNEGTDVREPRFLELDGTLMLYYAVLGQDSTKFEPQGMRFTRFDDATRTFSDPVWAYLPGFIPWRARTIGGKAYVIGYVGGDNIYDFNGKPIEIHFLTTTDGTTFEPVVPGKPIVQTGGGSETDFTFLDDGSLVAVTRNEAGDADFGFGSKICSAPANDLGTWTCKPDKRKYDSPLVFRHGADVYLVGRRNVTESGNYDLEKSDETFQQQEQDYEVDYSFNPKRTSLWKVDPATLTVTWVLDLPSRGDTCFPSILADGDGFTIYNYSNLLDGDDDCTSWPDDCSDIDWFVGQGRPTMIYRIGLTFPE